MIKKYQTQILVGMFLMAAILICYWQVQRFDFINLDDTDYVTENRRVQDGITLEGIKWAFTTNRSANWHPLTWLSHMLDCEFYGLNPTGHHWSNLLFHMANSLLLFLVFSQMTGAVWQSAFVAALFALHPFHVESVVWVSERKDVLSTFFGLLSIAAYIRYVRRKQFVIYFLCMLFLCLSLMAKPMLVTLPFVMLLLDYWPLGRFFKEEDLDPPPEGATRIESRRTLRLVLEKVPFFALVLLSCIATIIAQRGKGAIQSLDAYSMPVRLSNALVSYVKYIYKTFWPRHLSVHYLHPGHTLPVWQVACAAFFITGISYWAFRRARKHPYAAVGWCWFLGTLVPVIGVVQVGGQAMADRYTYIPLIGIFVILAWGVSALCSNNSLRQRAMAVCAIIVLSALGMRTHTQAGYWENSITLYENAIRVNGGSDLVHHNLGSALSDRKMFELAAFHYRKALKINPAHDDARNNLGNLMADAGNFDEAEEYYKDILQNNSAHSIANYNLGVLLIKRNRPRDAYYHFARAIETDPDFAKAYNYIGVLLARQGKFKEAGVFYAKAIQIDPDLVKARRNLERNNRRLTGGETLNQR